MPVPSPAHFGEPAELYDYFYSWKDYADEATRIRGLLHEAGIEDGARVLEGACGTAPYLAALAPHYQVGGFDLDEKMLEVARRKLPEAPLFHADLVDFQVDGPWDALLVLFGGICYVYPEDRLRQCARALFDALRPGGVALIEPWMSAREFKVEVPVMAVIDTPYLKVARQAVTKRRGRLAHLDFHFLIARPDAEVVYKTEKNTLFLYEPDEIAAALESAGFEVERLEEGFMPEGRLLRCRRPA